MIWAQPKIKSFWEDQLLKEMEVQAQYHGDGTSHTDAGLHTDTGIFPPHTDTGHFDTGGV